MKETTRIIQDAFRIAEEAGFWSWREKKRQVPEILARRVQRLRSFNNHLQRTLIDCMIENRELKDNLKRFQRK